jgi:hypothetical protein
MKNDYLGCAICGKPLQVQGADTQHGLPVHEECYLLRLKLRQATAAPEETNIATKLQLSEPDSRFAD